MELGNFIKELQDQKKGRSREEFTPVPAAASSQPSPTRPPPNKSDPGFRHAGGDITPAIPPAKNFDELKQQIHSLLVQKIQPEEVNKLPEGKRRAEIRLVVEHLMDVEAPPLNFGEKKRLIEELLDEILGFGPLEQLLRDPSVCDILVNGAGSVYVERRGVLEESVLRFRDNNHLMEIIQRIVSRVGRRVNESSPMVDARLPDGSRFNAIIPPLALKGPMVSIRRFGANPLKVRDLLGLKALTPEMAHLLEAAVKARLNLLISGGTGSGKTTLLNALSSFIPPAERIITIEDAAELCLQQKHVGSLEARPPNIEGKGEVTIRDLVRNALRMRPNRIIIGECRGAEALDMLQAMNTGHDGSMTTLHANGPRDALSRLEMMIMMSGLELPLRAMRQQIASSIKLVIQVDRLMGGPRRVTSITEVTGMEGETVTLQDLFVYRQLGVDPAGKAYGQFEATGIVSHFEPMLRAAGVGLAPDLFRERVLLRA